MIGVFGGSGFYELLEDAESRQVDTPYGPPAADPLVGAINGTEVAFMPRHGPAHEFPPHRIPYLANLHAMDEVGVTRIIAPTAVGSLVADYAPGDLVVPDQLVDRTWGRPNTFFDGPDTHHIPFADPYCLDLRGQAISAIRAVTGTVHEGGTTVVIQGPRFSTRAESGWFSASGWHLVNMTQLPEASLARELGLCYVNISVVTDYDVGTPGDIPAVTHDEVLARFGESLDTLRRVLGRLVPAAATPQTPCQCAGGRPV